MINRFFLISILIFMTFFLSGCTAGLTDPELEFEPPAYVEQMPAKENHRDFVATGSLFGQGDNPLFSDHKAMYINDIVTVVISETARSSSDGAKSLTEDNKLSLGAGAFTGGENTMLTSAIQKVNGLSSIGFNAGSGNTYTGKGSASKKASFDTTISARIVKVLSNGNYYIYGKRELLIDDQKQIIQVSGVIRPYDIDQNNKINSAQIADAKILYKTQGDIDHSTKEGWGSKLVKSVWPL